jgi:hypothetical protein
MLRDAGARQIAARLPGLSTSSMEVLAEMVTRLRQLEGLPDTAGGQASGERGTVPGADAATD